MNSLSNPILKDKVDSLPLREVGIDKVFFSDNDMINEIKSAQARIRTADLFVPAKG